MKRLRLIFSILLACAFALFFTARLQAAPAQILPGHVPSAVRQIQSVGPLPAARQLQLAITLPLRNQPALTEFLRAAYDPANPQYRHYLTPAEFTERFGPTPEDYAKVIAFAKASGFTITATHDDRKLLEVSAKTADIERAFNLTLRLYPHPVEKRNFFAPDTEPTIPDGLPILAISGLNNYLTPHPKGHRHPINEASGPANNTSRDGSGPNGNLIGSDYRVAYLPGVGLTGTGQSVGLFEWDGFFTSDVNAYEIRAKLTNPPPVQTIKINGFNGAAGENDGEVALDIEMAMSIAPGLTSVVSFEGSTNTAASAIFTKMVAAPNILQFSCSWFFPSDPSGTYDGYFQQFAAQGQSFYLACGDSGAYPTGQIPTPDDDPWVTLVGGTALLTCNANGSYQNEFVWDAPDIFDASSGGISVNYGLPPWQAGVATVANAGSPSARNCPDVAMAADNLFIVADDGQLETSGGTSASSPLWAGFNALVNQQAALVGKKVGFVNYALYSFYTNGTYDAVFNDITYGNNTNNAPDQFNATPGYDLCTGLGSPNGGSMIIALANSDGFTILPGRGFAASDATSGPFNLTTQRFTVTNSGSASLTWNLGNLPTWLTATSSSGTLSPDAAATVTVSLDAAVANNLATGVYYGNVWFTNQTSSLAQLRQFTLEVNQNIVHDGGFETSDLSYWTLSSLTANLFVDNGAYTYNPHSGEWLCAFGEVGDMSFIQQPLPTELGQPYIVNFWIENPTGDTPSEFQVSLVNDTSTDVIYDQVNLPAYRTWKNISLLTAATSTNTFLQFAGQDDNDYIVLDDVAMTPIPFPNVQLTQQTASSVTLTFPSYSGLQYQVQSTTDLTQGWSNLGSPVTATSTSTTVVEQASPVTAQYFRVQLLNVL